MGTWLPETCREQKKTYVKKELCVKLVIYKDYIEMHGQQNIKYRLKHLKKNMYCKFLPEI